MYGYVYLIGGIFLAAYVLNQELEYKKRRDKFNKEVREWMLDIHSSGGHEIRFIPMDKNYLDDLQKLKEIEK